MFDLAKRFALLEPEAGLAAIECVRVGASGRSSPCARCGWRMFRFESACENCGLAHEPLDDHELVSLPETRVTVDTSLLCASREALSTCVETVRTQCREVPVESRFAVRIGPRRFRREVRHWLDRYAVDRGIDVVCSPRALSRWETSLAGLSFRTHTPRRLAHRSLEAGTVLVLDSRSTLRADSATHARLRVAPHPFVIARVPERSVAEPEAMFALTDLVSPATFTTLHHARMLHRHDRAGFLQRRDSVVRTAFSRSNRTPANEPPDAPRRATLALVTTEGFASSRRIVTVTTHASVTRVVMSDASFYTIARSHPFDRACHVDPATVDAVIGELRDRSSRWLARTLARLAAAYAQRIDEARIDTRESLAREFASRTARAMNHASVRVCIAPLASVTIAMEPAHASR